MPVKFISGSSCCFDTELSEELITKCKKAALSKKYLMKFIVSMIIINWRVWCVPDCDF